MKWSGSSPRDHTARAELLDTRLPCDEPRCTMSTFNRILITGAAGEIGSTLRAGLRGVYPLLRSSDVRPLGDAGAGEETVRADLTDAPSLAAVMEDIECVVHLGGVPREAPWE